MEAKTISDKQIFLVCTGLGLVQRGFESYIEDLGTQLADTGFKVCVLGAKRPISYRYPFRRLFMIGRTSWISKKWLSVSAAFTIEQLTAAISLLPYILLNKPALIYLGEYQVYCHLFRFRKYLGLNYSLAMYTGGQAIPGLYDVRKDAVHHITNRYVESLTNDGYPVTRQFVLPHFINTDSSFDHSLYDAIKRSASGKIVVLSVGIIDAATKQMDKLITLLSEFRLEIYPVLLGEFSAETEAIRASAERNFGKDGFIMRRVSRSDLHTYYAAADIFILLSPKESFGLAYVEALMCGKPVVCRRFPESEFVLNDEAIYIEDDLTASLVIKNQLNSLIKNSCYIHLHEYACSRYSWKSLSTSYINMFQKMLSQPA